MLNQDKGRKPQHKGSKAQLFNKNNKTKYKTLKKKEEEGIRMGTNSIKIKADQEKPAFLAYFGYTPRMKGKHKKCRLTYSSTTMTTW